MTRVASAFVGCKVSQADADQALAELRARGARPAARLEDADAVVVYTCCVTAEAEKKSRRLVRRLARGGRRVVVAGCAATLRPGQFEGGGVAVLAGRGWDEVLDLQAPDMGQEGSGEAGAAEAPPSAAQGAAPGRTRLVLKVQDGCGGACSYCAVRLARGRPRSTPLGEALAAAARGLAEARGELVLSGIDLGAWRDRGLRLPDLVAALVELPGLARLRLSSLEPRHLDDALVAALDHPLVARHLHVPLQSADDGVLRAMRRPYTFEDYERRLAAARDSLGGLMVSTDVIVGFPGESDAAFGRTLAALRSGLFGRVHVFPYSARPGTEAAESPPLPAAVVEARKGAALAAAEAAARAARRAAIGRPADVLVEDRRNGLLRGYSSEYVRYFLDGDARPGTMVRAVARAHFKDGVRGTIA
jgi:threonylcarbamoyladenosine tRNA methylthiotransferase MtaB